jgi:hypothetical protein
LAIAGFRNGLPAEEEGSAGPARIDRELVGKAEALDGIGPQGRSLGFRVLWKEWN